MQRGNRQEWAEQYSECGFLREPHSASAHLQPWQYKEPEALRAVQSSVRHICDLQCSQLMPPTGRRQLGTRHSCTSHTSLSCWAARMQPPINAQRWSAHDDVSASAWMWQPAPWQACCVQKGRLRVWTWLQPSALHVWFVQATQVSDVPSYHTHTHTHTHTRARADITQEQTDLQSPPVPGSGSCGIGTRAADRRYCLVFGPWCSARPHSRVICKIR